MDIEIIRSVILNIGLLVIIAVMLSRFRMIRRFITGERKSAGEQIFLILLFGIIGIISTLTGYEVHGAIANTRVISVIAGGIIGGPVVGIGASIIAGLHRYFIDVNGITALACAISTMVEGGLSALAYNHIKVNKYKESEVFLLTFVAEILQMVIILIVARPFSEAWSLVSAIAFPMIMFNSIGMVFFIQIFKNIFIEQAYEIGKNTTMTFEITKKCLPILSKGSYEKESLDRIGEIIISNSGYPGVAFTTGQEVISSSGKVSRKDHEELIRMAGVIMERRTVVSTDEGHNEHLNLPFMKNKVAIGAPIFRNDEIIGTMILFTNKYQFTYQSVSEFVEGLTQFFSVQFGLAEMVKQREILRKVEYRALQSQINPHFIFNSLNTISAFCREKPDKARELLIALARYFRNSIKTKDSCVSIYEEMEYVEAYMQLEKARFDERLELHMHVEKNLDCQLPCLILQPIVENAIIHGAMKRKKGEVSVEVVSLGEDVIITVKDNGHGISQEIVSSLNDENPSNQYIGLSNVNRRLKYMFGVDRGLKISTSDEGTTIEIKAPKSERILDRAAGE
ncbi:LytS/YhcK type 5TM receptor domain-containing protein [Proteiniclasticum sp. C24MP]|uniref:LytS/YhcK type 5TM receptor domain-containing protein n=1 Tax=Proteiniclasticum sp. C24MP TaxID=3374101 RepID=UPI0037540507